MKTYKNTIKIYKLENEYPTFILESDTEINDNKWTSFWSCKEEIYIDETLIDTIYHTV
jgi:hypothetical protein